MAQRYYDEGDYYSAHYYASLALANPAVAPRASALVAAATAKIDPETPLQSKATPEEVAARRLAKDKRAAYEFFQREDWVTAYYEFGRLRSIYPDDTDIARFHDLALSRALASAFLIDEAREAMMEPGFTSLLFSERQENGIAVTAIGKMVGSAKGTYFEDVETLRYQPGKGPTLHVWARYGKLAGDGILLRALDPERREESEEPVVSVGEDTPDATILRSPERLDYLPYIKPGARSLRAVPAITLWGMRLQVRDSGVLAEALDLELLLFFVRPVLFLTLGLMGVGLAHRLRGRYYGRASPAAYSALALVPLALTGVWQLAADGARLLYGAVTAAAGLLPGAIAAAVVQSVLLVVALIGLSRSALE
jgi:hypothetical protein